MQYDLNNLGETALVKIKWHGMPTRVLVRGEAQKRDVATGEVIEVTLEQAKELLNINRLFTLDGDVPMKQSEPMPPASENKDEEGNVVLTSDAAEKLDKKKDVVDALKNLGVSFNDALSKNDLKVLLVETLKEKEAAKLAPEDNKEMNIGVGSEGQNAQ